MNTRNRSRELLKEVVLVMCMITLYKGSVAEENKLAENISRYSLDVANNKLTVYPMLKDPLEFDISKGVSWDESNDSMVI